jgi:hypothetical protein
MRASSSSGVAHVQRAPQRLGRRIAEHRGGAGVPAGDDAGEVPGPDGLARLLHDRGQQLVLRFALAEGGDQALDVVRHVVERLGREAHFGGALGVDAHGVVALAEAVGALGQHAQRAEVAAEDQPDELQHEEQRHRHDLDLLHELVPEAVLRLDRGHARGQLAVAHPARHHVDALLHVGDRGEAGEPRRGLELVGRVLRHQHLAVLVGPGEALDLALAHLVPEQLADRGVFADQRLIGDQRRDEGQRLVQLALEAGGMLGRPLGHEQRGLHAAAGDDRHAHGEHEAGNEPQVLPELKHAEIFHQRRCRICSRTT